MSDSVILRSVKKFGEDNHGFESDSSCKWPFILLSLVQKKVKTKVEQTSEDIQGAEKIQQQ